MSEPARLPESMRALLWDHDIESMSVDHDRGLIIERILAHGDLPHIRWAYATYGEVELRAWIRRTRGRALPRKPLLFWARRLDVPSDELSRWLEERQRSRFWRGLDA
jgi:hypothetical protein